MACYFPIAAYRDRAGAGKIRFGGATGQLDKIELPCGGCVGCRKERARSWSLRVMHEASLFDSNLFLTLDYAPEHLESWSIQYRDFQLFMKRLRKEYEGVSEAPNGKKPIRFFCAAEYGSQYRRPHFHAILFNTRFPDQVRYHNGTFRSESAERLWDKGRVVIGDVTHQSAAYVAGYTLGKVSGGEIEDLVCPLTGEVSARRREFITMSRRPGIGAWWFERYERDLFPHDFAVTRDGKKYKVPSYYWNRFQEEAPDSLVEEVRFLRHVRAKEVDPEENSEERREVKALQSKLLLKAREH